MQFYEINIYLVIVFNLYVFYKKYEDDEKKIKIKLEKLQALLQA